MKTGAFKTCKSVGKYCPSFYTLKSQVYNYEIKVDVMMNISKCLKKGFQKTSVYLIFFQLQTESYYPVKMLNTQEKILQKLSFPCPLLEASRYIRKYVEYTKQNIEK